MRTVAVNPVAAPGDLIGKPLLLQSSRRDAWDRWFRLAGVDAPPVTGAAMFEHFLMLAQAATAGVGVALIPSFLIEPELTSGALVCPISLSARTEEAYYVVYPDGSRSPALRAFLDWIAKEVA